MFKKISVFCLIVFMVQDASAQLMMEKSRVRLTVSPGETVVDSMLLYNTGATPADVKVYWQDFTYLPPFDGQKNFSLPGTSQYSMADWISYSPQLLTLPPQGKREINFTIKVPENAKGGYYGVLFFEQGLGTGTTSTGVNIITRLGSLFFVETVNRDKTAKIDNMRFEEKFLKGSFTNQGDVFMFPRGIYFLMDKEGLVTERGELDKIYLIPGNTAEFKVAIADGLASGDYTMVITLDLDDGDSLIKEVDFSKSESGQLQINEIRD